MTKLDPCPFCGETAKVITHSFYNERTKGFTDKTYSVNCTGCKCETYEFYETEAEAVAAWNMRVEKRKWIRR